MQGRRSCRDAGHAGTQIMQGRRCALLQPIVSGGAAVNGTNSGGESVRGSL